MTPAMSHIIAVFNYSFRESCGPQPSSYLHLHELAHRLKYACFFVMSSTSHLRPSPNQYLPRKNSVEQGIRPTLPYSDSLPVLKTEPQNPVRGIHLSNMPLKVEVVNRTSG